jgi:hypothetical protein
VRAMSGPGLGVHVQPQKVRRVAECVLKLEFD